MIISSFYDFSSLLAKYLRQTQGERGEGRVRFHRSVFIESSVKVLRDSCCAKLGKSRGFCRIQEL